MRDPVPLGSILLDQQTHLSADARLIERLGFERDALALENAELWQALRDREPLPLVTLCEVCSREIQKVGECRPVEWADDVYRHVYCKERRGVREDRRRATDLRQAYFGRGGVGAP